MMMIFIPPHIHIYWSEEDIELVDIILKMKPK